MTPHRRLMLVAAGLLAVALPACTGREQPPPEPPTRIEGIVLVGPQCPVEREGEPCPDEPAEGALVLVSTAGGAQVERVQTGDDGRFAVDVAPGAYRVRASTDAAMSCEAQDVVVAGGQTREVRISCDTGIR